MIQRGITNILMRKQQSYYILHRHLPSGVTPEWDHYLGVAKEKGITDNEIGAAQSIVMAVSAGRINAQFREVRKKRNNNSSSET
jgi:hypothetical protein